MEFEIAGFYYGLLVMALIILILFFNLTIAIKYKKLFDILVKYPKIEKGMLAFKPFENTYGFIPILHSDYFGPIAKRFFLLESFSKTKTENFYKKFYRYDLLEKTNDKEIKKSIDFILKHAPIRDILGAIIFILFIASIIVGMPFLFKGL